MDFEFVSRIQVHLAKSRRRSDALPLRMIVARVVGMRDRRCFQRASLPFFIASGARREVF